MSYEKYILIFSEKNDKSTFKVIEECNKICNYPILRINEEEIFDAGYFLGLERSLVRRRLTFSLVHRAYVAFTFKILS